MTGTCQFSLGESSGEAAWSYDGSSLAVTPSGSGPLIFAVAEFSGLAGDDYTVRASMPGASGSADVVLSRLGHDGPTLAEALRRDWLRARTDVLRLTGSGEGWSVKGQVSGLDGGSASAGESSAASAASEPFEAHLYEDVLVTAREGRDLEPLFLALTEGVSFAEDSYSVSIQEWPERKIVFSKLAKQTDEFLDRLVKARIRLSKEASATLAAGLSGISAEGRASLAGAWLPGRLMDLARMESLCPGFEDGFRNSWLAGTLRQEEVSYLLGRATSARTWLGCTREGSAVSEADEQGQGSESAQTHPLWALADLGGTWFLEPLSIEDHATYCFKGADELPGLVSRLLCAPQFSREALYSPLEELVGDKATLAIPAAQLGFLVQLRKRFQGRVIHKSAEAWKKEVERLS